MKKYVSVILSLLMIFSVVQTFSAVSKKRPGTYNNTIFEYKVKEDGKIELLKYLLDIEECRIPETIDNMVVDELDYGLFGDNVKTIYIPKNIVYIDFDEFMSARNLETIYTDTEKIR